MPENNDESTNVLLLAFDGLSSEDVNDQYVLNPFQLEKYTSIDLGKRPFYFTSELFTDLYTGWTNELHGVKGLKKMTEGRYGFNPTRFELWLQENLNPLFFSTKNLREGFYTAFLDSSRVKWEREDIMTPTLFQFDNISQGQMPVWDWRKAEPFQQLEREYNSVLKADQFIEDEFVKSKNKFWNNVEGVDWEDGTNRVYMHHFHYIDWLEHLYREKPDDYTGDWQSYWDETMREPWFNAAEFFEEVKNWAEDKNIELVVMSDHGIPEKGIGHRPNAFISSDNPDLLPDNPSLQEINYILLKILQGNEQEVLGKKE